MLLSDLSMKAIPKNDEWFGTRTTPYIAIGGFKALALLLVEGNDPLNQVSKAAWRKWIPILLTFPLTPASSDGRRNTIQCIDSTALPWESRTVWLYSIKT